MGGENEWRGMTAAILLLGTLAGAAGCSDRRSEGDDRAGTVPASETVVQPAPSRLESTGGDLLGAVWRWTRLEEVDPPSESRVSTPEEFTLVFRADGTLEILAECQHIDGSYTSSGSRLVLEFDAPTISDCDGNLLASSYLQLLDQVGGYVRRGEALVLDLAEGAARMVLEPATGASP